MIIKQRQKNMEIKGLIALERRLRRIIIICSELKRNFIISRLDMEGRVNMINI